MLVFPGVASLTPGLGSSLQTLYPVHRSLLESGDVLKPYDINLVKLLTESTEGAAQSQIHKHVVMTALQVCHTFCYRCSFFKMFHPL